MHLSALCVILSDPPTPQQHHQPYARSTTTFYASTLSTATATAATVTNPLSPQSLPSYYRPCHCNHCAVAISLRNLYSLATRSQDLDKSGSIDAHEMRRMMVNLGEDTITLEQVRLPSSSHRWALGTDMHTSHLQVSEILSHFDTNGDGQIDPTEFAQALLSEEQFGTEALALARK